MAVAEEGSVTRAAQRLGLTQSPVSQGIKRLEQSIGSSLFERHPQGVTLSESGKLLLPQARVLLRDAYELQRLADSSNHNSSIRLGLAPSVPVPCATAVAQQLASTAPDFHVREASCEQLLTAVGEGTLDCAVIEDPSPTGSLARGQLHEVPRILAGVSSKRLRGHNLQGYALYDDTRAISPAAADRLSDAFFSAGLSPRVESFPGRAAFSALVAAGKALALITPEHAQLWPGTFLPGAFNLRLRAVVPAHHLSAPDGRDLRALIDSALRESTRTLQALVK